MRCAIRSTRARDARSREFASAPRRARSRCDGSGARYAGARAGCSSRPPARATDLALEIEYPPDGAQVSSTVCGTFVAGRAQATHGTPRRFDVIIVIDTSSSAGIQPAPT